MGMTKFKLKQICKLADWLTIFSNLFMYGFCIHIHHYNVSQTGKHLCFFGFDNQRGINSWKNKRVITVAKNSLNKYNFNNVSLV